MTTLGGNTDGAIRAIGRSYDSLGRLAKVTSYSDTSASTVVNEVEQAYTDAGKLDEQYQAHNGSVSTSSTPSVGYSYETADPDNVGNGVFDHALRPTGLTYPDARQIDYTYGSSGSRDDELSRVEKIEDGATTLARYAYNGIGMRTEVDYEQPGVALDRDPDGDQVYEAWDRFGRVVDHRWQDTSDSSDPRAVALRGVAWSGTRTATTGPPIGCGGRTPWRRQRRGPGRAVQL